MSSEMSHEDVVNRYRELRSALGEIQQEFEHGARQFPSLYYESIATLKDSLSEQAWDNFIAANQSNDDDVWEQWEIDPDGESCVSFRQA